MHVSFHWLGANCAVIKKASAATRAKLAVLDTDPAYSVSGSGRAYCQVDRDTPTAPIVYVKGCVHFDSAPNSPPSFAYDELPSPTRDAMSVSFPPSSSPHAIVTLFLACV